MAAIHVQRFDRRTPPRVELTYGQYAHWYDERGDEDMVGQRERLEQELVAFRALLDKKGVLR